MSVISMPHHGLDPRRKTDQPALCPQCEEPIPEEHDDEIAVQLGTCLETACKLAQIHTLKAREKKWLAAQPILESIARLEVSDTDKKIDDVMRIAASVVREDARKLLEWHQCATCKRRIPGGNYCWEHDPQHDRDVRWQRS